jgi:hypothetical protein
LRLQRRKKACIHTKDALTELILRRKDKEKFLNDKNGLEDTKITLEQVFSRYALCNFASVIRFDINLFPAQKNF